MTGGGGGEGGGELDLGLVCTLCGSVSACVCVDASAYELHQE